MTDGVRLEDTFVVLLSVGLCGGQNRQHGDGGVHEPGHYEQAKGRVVLEVIAVNIRVVNELLLDKGDKDGPSLKGRKEYRVSRFRRCDRSIAKVRARLIQASEIGLRSRGGLPGHGLQFNHQ